MTTEQKDRERVEELMDGIGFATERDRVRMQERIERIALDTGRMDRLEQLAKENTQLRLEDLGWGSCWLHIGIEEHVTARGTTLREAVDQIV